MHTQWESLANTHILGIAPYEPGKPIEETEREYGVHDAIKHASNENPLAPSERVQRAIAAQLAHLNRYPDGSGFYLRQALAKKHGFTHDQIVLGNGSNELIELAVRTFLKPGDEAIVPHPSFVVYPMNRIRQPFNVNSLAQAAGLAALEDDNHVLECVRMIEAGRHFLYDEFKALGIRYVPSRANFILVDVGRSASDIYQRLLKEGVIVRPMTPFGMESALRVTVGTPQENGRLVKALKTVLGKAPA